MIIIDPPKSSSIMFFRFGYYFVEPVIAGLDPKTNEPYIATMDLIGCPMETKDFVVGGTCSEQLYGMCESLWNPDLVCGLHDCHVDLVCGSHDCHVDLVHVCRSHDCHVDMVHVTRL